VGALAAVFHASLFVLFVKIGMSGVIEHRRLQHARAAA